MAKITWSNPAIADLSQIREYYASTFPAYGNRLLDKLIARTEQLLTFPESGRLVPEFTDGRTRELIAGAYRIIYRIHSQEPLVIYIARVYPSAKPLLSLE